MKNLMKVFTLVLFTTLLSSMAWSVPKTSSPSIDEHAKTIGLEQFENMTLEEFLEMTPKKIEKATGQKLNLKQSIALKVAQKKIKKKIKKGTISAGGDSQIIALILVLLVGVIGIHRFYLGYVGIGIIQLLTLGMCGIWTLIDMIRILTGDLQPKDGPYGETL